MIHIERAAGATEPLEAKACQPSKANDRRQRPSRTRISFGAAQSLAAG
ncbi:hypothetical protein ACIRU3_44595 [Streptomyces sp. NPDC101151]